MSESKTTPIRATTAHPLSADGFKQITVITMGSVDSGKSTIIGVLSSNILDDGDGSARATVMVHPHEHASGNTSDKAYLSYQEGKRIFTFVDLAGHERYLRTTIAGIASTNSDLAVCCIRDKVTNMTIEHLKLAISLDIPIIIIFTKIDMVPKRDCDANLKQVKAWLRSRKKRVFALKNVGDYQTICNNKRFIPVIAVSNTTGKGVSLLRSILALVPKSSKAFLKCFTIDGKYVVQGYGMVVSGLVGEHVKKNDKLYLGPFRSGEFIPVHVRTIHNDFRLFVDELEPGCRGCLSLRMPSELRSQVHIGMILRQQPPDTGVCCRFQAVLWILHHDTTITSGYQAFVNCGLVSGTVTFTDIRAVTSKYNGFNGDELQKLDVARSGQRILVTMEFLNNAVNYILPNQSIVFREGKTRGTGVVTKVFELN